MKHESQTALLLYALLDEVFYDLAVLIKGANCWEVEVAYYFGRSAWSETLLEEFCDLLARGF